MLMLIEDVSLVGSIYTITYTAIVVTPRGSAILSLSERMILL